MQYEDFDKMGGGSSTPRSVSMEEDEVSGMIKVCFCWFPKISFDRCSHGFVIFWQLSNLTAVKCHLSIINNNTMSTSTVTCIYHSVRVMMLLFRLVWPDWSLYFQVCSVQTCKKINHTKIYCIEITEPGLNWLTLNSTWYTKRYWSCMWAMQYIWLCIVLFHR